METFSLEKLDKKWLHLKFVATSLALNLTVQTQSEFLRLLKEVLNDANNCLILNNRNNFYLLTNFKRQNEFM